MTSRHARVVDVFVLLHRDDGRVLLLRRAGDIYASGLLCPPSGHLEPGETVEEGARREVHEETGVTIHERDLEFCHLIDHRSPEGVQRLGVAFTAQRWVGEPYNRELHKHSALIWADPGRPPADCVPYTTALLTQFTRGALLSIDGYTAPHRPPARSTEGLRYVDTSPPDIPASVPEQPRMTQEQYARSRHSMWLSAAALFTDKFGQILLVKPTYRTQWLIPGGGAEPGEGPHETGTREVHEELGLERGLGRVLAVNWLAPGHRDVAANMPFPGEVRYVLDGGTLTHDDIAAIRLPADELHGYEFLPAAAAAEHMIPVDAKIVLAALHARQTGTTALLDGGHPAGTPEVER